MDKLVGNNSEPFNTEEIEVLIFAFESHILFDNVAHKFLSSLKGLPEVHEADMELEDKAGGEEEQFYQENLIKERSDMVKAVLFTVIKEHIFRDISLRFGT
ncbi:hypothetical protein QP794_20835 [Paenibacillus sp. UMB7766-LJ446]|uniref:hypothetical protein n=1 Tax=Paenibacillus sp. UMB7766-LJ446 TaxID=3046313 RepID=UPI002550510C|nr:hypothetical protein [Paenibacillus sp. UMB7766-LJ446]MDK8192536.1 hypothetical protein [Paenibacillus sp. UMB7766-LJ446]